MGVWQVTLHTENQEGRLPLSGKVLAASPAPTGSWEKGESAKTREEGCHESLLSTFHSPEPIKCSHHFAKQDRENHLIRHPRATGRMGKWMNELPGSLLPTMWKRSLLENETET